MELLTTNNLNTVEGIEKALAAAEGNVQRGLLEILLASKKREIELANKLASKKSSTKKSDFSPAEIVLKSIFVAVRPHVASPEDYAATSFKAATNAIGIDLTVDLQAKLFATSIVHCTKSNFNKATNNIANSYNNYKETVQQAKILLPNIPTETWDRWLYEVGRAAETAATRRAIEWSVPTEGTDNGTADIEPVQEPVQPEQTETVQEPAKITVVRTRGKRK